MSNEITTTSTGVDLSIMEQVIAKGDLAQLTPQQRVSYYIAVCDSLRINPATRPFEYIILQGKLTLYATKNCAEQLRSVNNVSVTRLETQRVEDTYIVSCHVATPDGRTDVSTGVVSIANARGDALANAMMKAETKAKRRATLSICGLGWADESEIETIKGAARVTVSDTGEIITSHQLPAQTEVYDPQTDLERARAFTTPKGARLDSLTDEQLEKLTKAIGGNGDLQINAGVVRAARDAALSELANLPAVDGIDDPTDRSSLSDVEKIIAAVKTQINHKKVAADVLDKVTEQRAGTFADLL